MSDRTFAQRLRQLIDENPDLTEAGVATAAGLDNSTVRQLLAGKSGNPRFDTAVKICAALGMTIEEFMGRTLTKEERDIRTLVSRLSVQQRQKLLGFGEGILSAENPPPSQSPSDDQ